MNMECFGEGYLLRPHYRFVLDMPSSLESRGFNSRFSLIWFLLSHWNI